MKLNYEKLEYKELCVLDSFLVFAKLKGYHLDKMTVYENNLTEKNDTIFLCDEKNNILISFGENKKILF